MKASIIHGDPLMAAGPDSRWRKNEEAFIGDRYPVSEGNHPNPSAIGDWRIQEGIQEWAEAGLKVS